MFTSNPLLGCNTLIVSEVKPYARDTYPPTAFSSWMTRVRVNKLSCNSDQIHFDILFGAVDQFPLTQQGGGGMRLLPSWHIQPILGGNESLETLKKPISDKRENEIPPFTFLDWRIIWHKHKAKKGAAFLWSVIHKAVAVNEINDAVPL